MPDQFRVHAETVDDGDKVSCGSDDIPVIPDSEGRVFIQLDTNRLMAYRDYTAWIVGKNDFGESNSTIPFSKLVCVTASRSHRSVYICGSPV